MEKEDDLVKVFTGSEVTVLLLKEELEQIGVQSYAHDDFQTGLSAGVVSGVPSAIDLYIQKSDLGKADPLLEEFKTRNS